MKEYKIFIVAALMTVFLFFASICLMLMGMPREETIYVESPLGPIYEIEYVENDVITYETVVTNSYINDEPVLPITKGENQIILIDKSGSMESFVSELYSENIEFFTESDIWTFDTEIQKNVDMENITFEGDTNICMAVEEALSLGYDTIWICSDMEQTVGDININFELNPEINIIIYSPRALDETSTQSILTELDGFNTQIITIN